MGALACVINIITENAETFQGQQVTLRTGQIEQLYSVEYKIGKKFKDDSGLYFYTGVARNYGSDEDYSPMDSPYPMTWGYVHDQIGYRDIPKLKFYLDYMNGPFELWGRYTRGGTRFDRPMRWTVDPWDPTTRDMNLPPDPRYQEMGYQQLILATNYTFEVSDKFKVDTSFSYDMFDIELLYGSGVNCSREDKYMTKLVAKWNPNEKHSFAFGGSWLREYFGIRSPGYPGKQYWGGIYNPACLSMIYAGLYPMPKWTTDTFAVFGEHQWRINDKWTSFLGFRMDKNTFTQPLWSSRATLIFTPTDKDTFKVMFSRAVRLNFASEMYLAAHPQPYWVYDEGLGDWVQMPPPPGSKTKPEVLYAYELRYERQQTKNLWLAGSIFFHDHKIKGYSWEGNIQSGTPVGNMQTYGLEFEGIYKKGKNEIILSHSYTKMYDFDSVRNSAGTGPSDQMFTSEP